MSINNHKLAYLAKLSKFSTEDQTEKTIQSIKEIIHLIDHLQNVPTDHLVPLSHPLDETQRLRKDQVHQLDQTSEIRETAPAMSEDGYFLTPMAIKS